MIPHAILSGELIWTDDSTTHIRILELSVDSYTFRLSKRHDGRIPEELKGIRLIFTDLNEEVRWDRIRLRTEVDHDSTAGSDAADGMSSDPDTGITITQEPADPGEEELWTIYRVMDLRRQYADPAGRLTRRYMNYIRLRQQYPDAEVSEALVGYPADRENEFPGDREELWSSWVNAAADRRALAEIGRAWEKGVRQFPELGLYLDRPELWERYLHTSAWTEFIRWFMERLGVESKDFSFAHLQIGNAGCIHLFPRWEYLRQILEQASRQGLNCTVVLPPLDQDHVHLELPEQLTDWAENAKRMVEVCVNDWGTAERFRECRSRWIRMTAGIHLNKYLKDPRTVWISRNDACSDSGNAWSTERFCSYAKKLSFSRVHWESCGTRLPESALPGTLEIPFYTMNQSGFCTMAAACSTGDRGHQSPMEHCPRYCSRYTFLYPSFLKMVGYGGSLVGFDDRSLWDGAYLEELCSGGRSRLIFSILPEAEREEGRP